MKSNTIHIKPSHKGRLHEALHVPDDHHIPADKLAQALKSENPAIRKEANFAKNAESWDHRRS
jgi:hypothetical protein